MSNYSKSKGGGIKAFLIILLVSIFIISAGIVTTKGVTDKWPWEYLKKVETEPKEPEEPADPSDPNDPKPTYDGKSLLFITLTKKTGGNEADALTLTFCFYKSDVSELSVNWGDDTETYVTTESGYREKTHTYENFGSYKITVWISAAGERIFSAVILLILFSVFSLYFD